MEQNVLITGASGGIGRAIALAAARENRNLILCFNKNEAAVKELAIACEQKGSRCLSVRADVTSEQQVLALFAKAESAFGAVNVLINNAGLAHWGLLQDMTADQWDLLFAVNVRACFLTSKCALPAMIRAGFGRIVNIASMWGQVGASCEVAYSAAKGALISMTKALAKEAGPSGITVNCISPGLIDTPMNAALSAEAAAALIEETPVGRIGTPEDVASAVNFLISPETSFVTGQVIGINGGFVV